MIALPADFAPEKRKSMYIAMVVTGLSLGILIGRLIAGMVANFSDSWRNVYWYACGVQYLLVVVLYFRLPDYPSTNPEGLGYFKALWSIVYLVATEPTLAQAAFIFFSLFCAYTSYWTTLTFLLSASPYGYSTFEIGLFALLGLVSISFIALSAKHLDRFVSLVPVIIAMTFALICIAISTGISTFTVAGPVIHILGLDLALQVNQVACRAAVFRIDPKAKNRLNTAYMAIGFSGQLTGTAVGNRLYALGGWRWSSGASIGVLVLGILIAVARGPRETRWIGWRGGWSPRALDSDLKESTREEPVSEFRG